MKNKASGQSLIEIIFSVAVVSLVIVGVVSLIVNVIGVKNESLKRKRAVELGNVVVEDLLKKKNQDIGTFWNLTDITSPQSMPGFVDYTYTVSFVKKTGDGCRTEVNDCAEATINVVWDEGQNSLSVSRFFSRRI